mmetsp:Transcript_15385/g.30650  ORF Transcript_15385/g.30650 Transcript_15385/m.30650 type:complete len:323 (+) Transcript_15385:132-1100(+)|eukprot:CAMPEP_0182454534 /NCGR_PEP_ID=MMETSP1319-20130603/1128_1 /TAXON_ID=172717 /ORGANISM="Bolidomonas pacifica, Strain RCC208" /LENGTH=322 /DNA_ID=CAMNT_0024652551 /DNA_START=126 /DNA_END=1094 /DNA_ORIENTATION=+
MLSRFAVKVPVLPSLRPLSTVSIVEVGPRDGLQNEPRPVPLQTKLSFIEGLAEAGLRRVEATAFVSPKWVPQMSDSREVMDGIRGMDGSVEVSVLAPNAKGLEGALESGRVDAVAVFGAASEAFSRKNINCSIEESVGRFSAVARGALEAGLKVRGYVSCVAGCPYEGEVDPRQVVKVWRMLKDLGCYEVSLGDTVGVGTPREVGRVLEALKAEGAEMGELAGHFHDTYGMAVSNVVCSMDHGVFTFDSSAAGLGGCPYAAGASGNLATEDLLYLCEGMGLETGVDFGKVVEASKGALEAVGIENRSKAARAWIAKREKEME